MTMHAPLVYFIGSNEYVKIGTTTKLDWRFREIAKALPFEVELFGVLDGDKAKERSVQRKFKHFHTRMEWFVFHQEIRAFIDAHCRMIPLRRARDYSPGFDVPADRRAADLEFYKLRACREGRRLEIDGYMKKLAQEAA
jgi:hypothetical protein